MSLIELLHLPNITQAINCSGCGSTIVRDDATGATYQVTVPIGQDPHAVPLDVLRRDRGYIHPSCPGAPTAPGRQAFRYVRRPAPAGPSLHTSATPQPTRRYTYTAATPPTIDQPAPQSTPAVSYWTVLGMPLCGHPLPQAPYTLYVVDAPPARTYWVDGPMEYRVFDGIRNAYEPELLALLRDRFETCFPGTYRF